MADDHAARVNLDLSGGKQVGEREWELPSWHTHWGRFVYPLLAMNSKGNLFPLGTSFRFSGLNHVLTARHNVEEGLRKHHPHSDRFVRDGIKAVRKGTLDHTRFAFLTQGPNPNVDDVSLEIRQFDSMHAAPPTDLIIGNFLQDGDSPSVPFIHPLVSFVLPRIGESVCCIGYADMSVPEKGLSIRELKERRVSPYDMYSHRLIIVFGRVKNIFLSRDLLVALSKGHALLSTLRFPMA